MAEHRIARVAVLAIVVGAWCWACRQSRVESSPPHNAGNAVAAIPKERIFAPTVPSGAPAPGAAPSGMVWIPGGEFSMGAQDPRGLEHGGHDAMPDARPIHRVSVAS